MRPPKGKGCMASPSPLVSITLALVVAAGSTGAGQPAAACEPGHWLFGRGHAPSGLMRASIERRDLVSTFAPALPGAWPSQARCQLRVRRPCPGPDAFRQPVTE